jgi:hypothetical protein
VNYSKALANLNPILRRRLYAIAALAEMTELEALQLIVEAGSTEFAPTKEGRTGFKPDDL